MPYAPQAHKPRSTQAKPAPRRDTRASASERGYGRGWSGETGLRTWYISRRQLCEDCIALGLPVVDAARSLEVDHIIPLDEANPKADPLRLDQKNLRTRCRRHHALKEKDDAVIRGEYDALRAAGVPYAEARDRVLVKWREAMVADGPKNHTGGVPQ